MNTYSQIVVKIIKEQELIIGPLAWFEAGKVAGIHIVNQKSGEISIGNDNNQEVVNNLVLRYENLFGRASREVCKEAAASLLADLSPSEVPSSLR